MLPRLKDKAYRLGRTFLTGLAAILPLAATFALLAWAFQLLSAWLGPSSMFGSVLVAVGVSVSSSESIGYVLGLILLCVAIWLLGVLVEAGLQVGIQRLIDRLMQRIPLVRNVYDVITRMVELFSRKSTEGLGSMSPVWLHFGGRPAEGAQGSEAQKVAVLALLCTPEPVVMDGGRRYLGVLVPTAPVPVGGGLLYVPEEWVSRADIGVEALTSIYVSMGLTTNQYMNARTPPGMSASPVDPVLAAILWTLWGFAQEPSPETASLARLAKRRELAMSSLRRGISALEEAGLVMLRVDEKGRECALLTDAGHAFCEDVFPKED